jgi:predicted dehydrogenase
MTASALQVLVVGTVFGCRIQVPALRAAGFEVVGLVGTQRDRTHERAEVNGVPAAFTDLEEAITQTGAGSVAIATPPHTHGPLVLAAARRGCHIICEKPFARDSDEARAMLDAARRAGVVHLIGHEFRLVPSWAKLARAVAEGLIGEPRLAISTSYTPALANPAATLPDGWHDKTGGGGWLGAQGSHLIDWMRCVLGEIDSLSAALPIVSDRNNCAEDSYVIRFRTAGGAEGVLQHTAAAWGPPFDVTRVAGTKGTVWMEAGEVYLADADGVRPLVPDADLALPPMPPVSDDPRYHSTRWKLTIQHELLPYLRLCEGFRALIERRKPRQEVPLATFEDGLACMRVVDAVRRSAKTDGALISLA